MSHIIDYSSFPESLSQGEIYAEVLLEIMERGYPGELYNPIRWLDGVVMDSYKEAEEYLRDQDEGFYDNLAVKYKSEFDANVNWLVKYEFHV